MGGSFLRVRLSPGERIFALATKAAPKWTRIFVIVRDKEREGDFRAREMIDLGGWTASEYLPWLMSDQVPLSRDTYEELIESDDAEPVLETFPSFPSDGKVEMYMHKVDQFEKSVADAANISPKVLGWLARLSTTGRSFDVFLTRGWNGFEYGYALAEVTDTGTSIPVRNRSFLISNLKLVLPTNWDGKTKRPLCPHCDAPSPHLHNGAEGEERSYRCNTCGEDFQDETPKRKSPRRS